MNNKTEVLKKISKSIGNFKSHELFDNSIKLFTTLGYNTDRQSRLENSTYAEFEENYLKQNDNIDLDKFKEKAKTGSWQKIEILFQLTDNEMSDQGKMFDAGKFDNAEIYSYLFIAIELQEKSYTRTNLSDITRQINRVFSMPVLLLFRYGDNLTLSIIKRRLNKKDANRDVLEKVTLIKDINILDTHRAHIEILYDLSLEKLRQDFTVSNFTELQTAWQKTLDSSELNRKFYKEIANWYFWAVENVEFPDDLGQDKSILNATATIRLLTRLIFVWFIKEKSIIPEDLFNEKELKQILTNFDTPENSKKTIFYKAILQNLFFATLSTEKRNRKFRTKNWKNGRNIDYGNQYVYRYENMVADVDKWKALFADIPFLNGGLFENLDNKENKIMVDGFSEESRNKLKVPDYLFFSKERYVDLNKTYDTKGKTYKVKGLIEILNKYKFTIAENTPIEEEIALDPELLGKVFENLLASFNPETKTTARKQTGSFYTPREIVDYMVDESLKSSISNLVSKELEKTTSDDIRTGLDILFAYTEKEHAFNEKEIKEIVKVISQIKIIDPACGSGAFPMGILHKLTFILNKLDPNNTVWRELQKKKAIEETEEVYNFGNQDERQHRLNEIEEAFESNTSNYGRKLFLIENAIYGVDIQPIAVQISKLRFFISLIVDQDMRSNIKPLPNLETKFVAADTLIGRKQKEAQSNLFDNPEIDKLEKELKVVRHKHFNARNPKDKEKIRQKDKSLREKIAELVQQSDGNEIRAKQLISWNPYDQNNFAPFFDPEWMYGIKDGFDIVIGNPPYGQTISEKKIKNYLIANYFSAEGKFELYKFFIEWGLNQISSKGSLCYITPDTWVNLGYFKKLRTLIINHFFIASITNSLYKIFEAAMVDTIVFLITRKNNNTRTKLYDKNNIIDWTFTKLNIIEDNYSIILKPVNQIIESLNNNKIVLGNITEIWQGLIAYGKKNQPREWTSYSKDSNEHRKLLFGGDIGQYKLNWSGKYLKYGDWLHRPRPSYIFDNPKLLVQRIRNPQIKQRIVSTLDEDKYLNGTGLSNILITDEKYNLRFILAIINSKLINYWFSYYFHDVNIKPEQLRKIPLPKYKTSTSAKLFVDILLFNKGNIFFISILDSIIFNLYFPEHMKERGIDVLEYVERDIESVMQGREFEDLSDTEKEKVIERLHKIWTDPDNEVVKRMARFKEKSPYILKVILES